jgi:hypothetical protein
MNPGVDDKGGHAMVRRALAKERLLHSFGISKAPRSMTMGRSVLESI